MLSGLTFFFFEIYNLTSYNFFFFSLSRKFVFVISCPFQLNFIYIFSFEHCSNSRFFMVLSLVVFRGGVEDTRLEAKAKDTKKIRGQGQGQPFRGQTLSRPRTGTLDAKDQGHKRKCSPKKKKGLHKNFSGDLQKRKRSSQKFFRRSPQKNVFQKFFKCSTKF